MWAYEVVSTKTPDILSSAHEWYAQQTVLPTGRKVYKRNVAWRNEVKESCSKLLVTDSAS